MNLEKRLVRAVRNADLTHEKTGGGTNHYVRDCLLPSLADEVLTIVDEREHRAALVRRVVAEQWGVAISFWWDEARGNGLDTLDTDHEDARWSDDEYAAAAALAAKNMRKSTMVRHFARMPCAVDVVGRAT
jgi:hypothetical protein